MRSFSFLAALAIAVIGTASCSTVGDLFEGEDAPLAGERISILELEDELEPDDPSILATGFVAPAPWLNEFWPQAGGYPGHSMQNLALPEGELEKQWSSGIGHGASKRLPLTAQPVIFEGRIFTLDTDSELSAFDVLSGKRIWRTDVRAPGEEEAVIGGGMACSGGVLYVTTGYDEVLALNPADGEIVWRADIPTPSRAAPTVMGERVFVSTLDNRALALDASTGDIIWEHAAIGENIGLVGAASPAADHDIVVPVFSSGEIFALRVENGSVAWSDNLSSLRGTAGLTGLSDITGLPVMNKDMVIAVSFSGKMVAIDERTGSRVWQREISSSETPWVAGNMVFVTSSDNKLVSLSHDSGTINWVSDLNDAGDEVVWTGPLLAGNRLIIASSEGDVAEYNPADGGLIRKWSAGGAISMPPVIAGGTLYLLTDSGRLTAYK